MYAVSGFVTLCLFCSVPCLCCVYCCRKTGRTSAHKKYQEANVERVEVAAVELRDQRKRELERQRTRQEDEDEARAIGESIRVAQEAE